MIRINPECSSRIGAAYKRVNSLASSPAGYSTLNNAFSLCSPVKSQDDINRLWDWINNAIM